MKKINLIKGNPLLGTNTYTGALTQEFLEDNTEIPFYIARTSGSGYQRLPNRNRVLALSNKILASPKENIGIVNSLTLNYRSSDEEQQLKLIKGKGGPGSIYEWSFNEDTSMKIQVVDGQTRILAGKEARKTAHDEKKYTTEKQIKELAYTAVILFTKDMHKEAYIFYSINKYAKTVPPVNAERIIYEGVMKGEVNFQNEIASTKSAWKIDCNWISDELREKSLIWGHPRIRDANETSVPQPTVTGEAMTRIIKPVWEEVVTQLKRSGSTYDPRKKTFEVIEAYWTAISKIYPKIWQDLSKYTIQKSSSAEVLHRVLPNLIKIATTQKKDITKYQTYVALMKVTLKGLKETVTDSAGNSRTAKDHEFWLSGERGAAGKYTSAAAKKQLSERIVLNVASNQGVLVSV